MSWTHAVLLVLLLALGAHSTHAAAVFVSGEAPDFDQPYTYVGPPHGPGPNPGPGPDAFDAWCAPTSASNLLGHWEDARGVAVGDGVPFAMSIPPFAPIPWPAPPIWHDWNLGSMRPAPAPGPPPMTPVDAGWFMDTNNSGSTSRGNGPHVGTYTKDIHVGLLDLFSQIATATPGVGTWTTGTRGAAFALGLDSTAAPATPHVSAAAAFAEIRSEIDKNRTLIVTWAHWNITAGPLLAPLPGSGEAQYGGAYYTFVVGPPPADPWGNDEVWPEEVEDPSLNLGHVTTAVGYIPAGDIDDINAPLGMPTDWVIVHDNVPGTPRNVIVPLTASEYAGVWIANTNAVRTPPPQIPALSDVIWFASVALVMATSLVVAMRRRYAAAG